MVAVPFLEMSDEDFLKQQSPDGGPPDSADSSGDSQANEPGESDSKAVESNEDEPEPKDTDEDPGEGDGEDEASESGSSAATGDSKSAASANPLGSEQGKKTEDQAAGTKEAGTKEPGKAEADKTAAKSDAPDYEGFYKQVMTPFKANGKNIELKSPAEAIQLMQMGANYTRKMQELAPHRKVLLMLENNGLLDEGKLSYLIDLDKKNPLAVKKLVKDSGVDPMDIDTSVDSGYQEGNHRVTDEEAGFRAVLDEMKSDPVRVQTLQTINSDWDQASKEMLWKSPEVMHIIHQQRENGIYDRITTEMNRQRTLGAIPPNVPFIQAYKAVGDQMVASGGFADLNQRTSPQVVATRVAAPKAPVANNDRARAASPTRTSSSKSKDSSTNPLSMSDDEFLKMMENRL